MPENKAEGEARTRDEQLEEAAGEQPQGAGGGGGGGVSLCHDLQKPEVQMLKRAGNEWSGTHGRWRKV